MKEGQGKNDKGKRERERMTTRKQLSAREREMLSIVQLNRKIRIEREMGGKVRPCGCITT